MSVLRKNHHLINIHGDIFQEWMCLRIPTRDLVPYDRIISPIIKCRVAQCVAKSLLFGYRKWNILAFRRRLMSLLVLTHCGVSSRPLGLRLLAPPKTFAPTGVSYIPFASIGYLSQPFTLLF